MPLHFGFQAKQNHASFERANLKTAKHIGQTKPVRLAGRDADKKSLAANKPAALIPPGLTACLLLYEADMADAMNPAQQNVFAWFAA
jgi:hypothetical protein